MKLFKPRAKFKCAWCRKRIKEEPIKRGKLQFCSTACLRAYEKAVGEEKKRKKKEGNLPPKSAFEQVYWKRF